MTIKSACYRALGRFKKHTPKKRVLPSKKHQLTDDQISNQACMVMERLVESGYSAYLVGGSVRDVMVSLKPKDFDVVTDATPEEINRLFRQSRIIGRRFRLVHVYGRGDVTEVSTFRANSQTVVHVATDTDADEMPMVIDDNTYGTIEEDAWRRDFTINALFYDYAEGNIIDFTGGVSDIKARRVAMIGDATQRFHEDPVRLLRAIRMAAKLDFSIEKRTYRALLELPGLLQHVAPARLFDEVGKLFFTGHALSSYEWLLKTGYFEHIFPQVHKLIMKDESSKRLVRQAMKETDDRFAAGRSLNPGYLLAVLYWPIVQEEIAQLLASGYRLSRALPLSFRSALALSRKHLAIPKRFQAMMQSIWSMQYHLEKERPKRIERLLMHRYCRAAVDFLELRVRSGWKEGQGLAKNWRKRLNDSKHTYASTRRSRPGRDGRHSNRSRSCRPRRDSRSSGRHD